MNWKIITTAKAIQDYAGKFPSQSLNHVNAWYAKARNVLDNKGLNNIEIVEALKIARECTKSEIQSMIRNTPVSREIKQIPPPDLIENKDQSPQLTLGLKD